jgi:(R,R)-butanediol dehydrogenase/meso-butanediol dehydrogenase/diacetyl reductase/L-iditol 2-dehydrogenase
MSGNTKAAEQILQVISRGGDIVYFSNYRVGYHIPVNAFRLVNHEISISGVYQSPYMFPRVMAILPILNLDFLTSNVFNFEDALEAWEAHISKKYPKIILKIAKDM